MSAEGKRRLPVLRDDPPSVPLPPLHESKLDWDGVDCVLADLDDFAVLREILGRPADGTPTKLADIVEARDRFVAGALHGLQITYEFADDVWIDTLLREQDGARLLRMTAPTDIRSE